MLLTAKSFKHSIALALLCAASTLVFAATPAKTKPKTPEEIRADYIKRLQEGSFAAPEATSVGSLWTPGAALGDFNSDYKALHLNDTITILVSVQTTAAQSGTVDSERSFSTNSAITGVMGNAPKALNPLLAANSASVHKGQGSTSTTRIALD